ncbi:MAG: YkgJ family cysteine cluster protein [Planctomycetes bacterium]|nr:YkgJ family cysteine cluster protein [Planctomycetota bacterium]
MEIPEWLRYECTGCGMCCRRGLNIWCPLPDRIRLGDFEWAKKYPQLKGHKLFLPYGPNYRFALDEKGACLFLTDENKCIQHSELGFDAKTLTCKMFPYNLLHSNGKVYVSLLFSCPAVIDGIGPKVSEQTPTLKKLLKEMDGYFPVPPLTEETALTSRRPVTFRNLELLEAKLIAALSEPELPLVRKILRAASLLDRLEETCEESVSKDEFANTLEHYDGKCRDEARNCGLKHIPLGMFERLFLRMMQGACSSVALSGLTSKSFIRRQSARLRRFFLAMRYMYGSGEIPAQKSDWEMLMGAESPARDSVSFRLAREVSALHLPDESEELIARYLKTKFGGRTYFGREGWGLAVIPGARVVLSLASIVVWHAKVRAALDNRNEVAHKDIREAVLLTEHTFGHASSLHTGFVVKSISIANRAGWPQKAALHTML